MASTVIRDTICSGLESEIAQLKKLRKGLMPGLSAEVELRINERIKDLEIELTKARSGLHDYLRSF